MFKGVRLTAALGEWPLQHYQTSIPLAGKLISM